MKVKINKRFVGSLIFNIAETALIFLIGKLLDLPILYILFVMVTFMISRRFFGKSLHYKDWYRCLIWSSVIFLCLFLYVKIDLKLSVLFTIFSALIMTNRGDVLDIYLWNNHNEPSKYQDIIDYIKYNEFNDTLISFENKLKEKSSVEYLVYKYRFKEHLTFSVISERLDLEGPRIVEILDRVAFAIRMCCGI